MSRNTDAKRIRGAKSGPASEIAWFGRELSELERQANLYLYFSQPKTYDRQCREESATDLLGAFLDEVDKQNGAALRNLGWFIEHWPHKPRDVYRLRILEWKESCEREGRKMRRATLAKVIGWPDYMGLDQLGRWAKELKFPLKTR